MADASYDAIVIGGGHHGTIIACYLAEAGLKTAVFERQHELGGGAATLDLPLPGFLQNPCAHFTRFWAHPAYTDFNLKEYGLQYIFPDQNEGMVYDDGTAFIGYSAYRVNPQTFHEEYAADNVNKTLAEIARFSKRDADTAANLLERYEKAWRQAFREYRYSAPTPWGVDDPLERLCHDKKYGMDPVWQFMTSNQIAYDLFESPELRTLFMRAVPTSTGSLPGDVIGLYTIVHTLALVLSWESASIALTGTHAITHALQKAFTDRGGVFHVLSEVDRVLVENGRAVGIRLADGTEVQARKFIVSALGVPQTILRLLGEEHVTDQTARRVRNIDYDRSQIFWGNIAMHELPKYTAVDYNPDVGKQPRLYMGPKDPEYLAWRYQADIFTTGMPSKWFTLAAPDSIWDRSRAPGDKHTILVEEFTAPYRLFSEKDWLRMKEQVVDRFLTEWQKYAPNMTRDNVIGAHIMTPRDVVHKNIDMREGGWVEGSMFASQLGRFRPVPEFANYRTPVPNLYLCSSNMHSGGGIGRGSSYAAFKTIVEDQGLPKIWEAKGRPY